MTPTPNLAGLSAFPDIDLIAELRERGYSVNKDITDREIQDVLTGYSSHSRYMHSGAVDGRKLYTLGDAIKKIREMMNVVQ